VGLIPDVGIGRRLVRPFAQRVASLVGEAVDPPRAGLSGLDGGGDPAEALEALWLGVDLAGCRGPERGSAASAVVDQVVRAGSALADQGEDRVTERDRFGS
jgi:hypothetical protein